MHHRYQIVIFRNRKKFKTVYRSNSIREARLKYKQFSGEVKSPFYIQRLNCRKSEFYIGLISNGEEYPTMAHAKDSLGRNVTMPVEEGQGILELAFYYWPEKIYDNHLKKRIYFEDLMRSLDKIEGLKMIYKLNAHVLVETEEVLHFYSLKYVPDALRLINLIIEKRREEGINDCLYSRDGDTLHRKYLYQRLTEAGYNIKKLYKHYSR